MINFNSQNSSSSDDMTAFFGNSKEKVSLFDDSYVE